MVLSQGCKWRAIDGPEASWNSIYQYSRDWSRRGVWAELFARVGSKLKGRRRFLDVARTVCRRAEREVVALGETGAEVNAEIVRFLNRLSDLCWLWARWVETRADGETGEDVPRV